MQDTRTPLGFGHLGHAFIFYGTGIGLALTAFAVEIVCITASRRCIKGGPKELDRSLHDLTPVEIHHVTKPVDQTNFTNEDMNEESSGRLGKTYQKTSKDSKFEVEK